MHDFIFRYQFITIPFIAWLTTQTLKFVFDLITSGRIDFRRLVGAGGMPSSHSAFVVSLATVIGVSEGLESAAFGLAVAFALVVMYDAAGDASQATARPYSSTVATRFSGIPATVLRSSSSIVVPFASA